MPRYGVKSGQDQAFWEAKGWIHEQDPRGLPHSQGVQKGRAQMEGSLVLNKIKHKGMTLEFMACLA